ncbi:hypothetical protein [Ewingella americana]|uniref:Uncharacterized protein n=1 Tax=Ewingella americana TaxID=41202 RepID=A0A502GFZ5_9GAMM|nr:hypothetical protein [Ewingella americana]TPG59916.1 hypothetical protein EAH77_15225 [Ewingella americana]
MTDKMSDTPCFKYKVPRSIATEKMFMAIKEEGHRFQMLAGILQNPDALLTEDDLEQFGTEIDSHILSLTVLKEEVQTYLRNSPASEEDLRAYLAMQAKYK